MMTLAAMQRIKMPIWNFQRHLAGLSLYPAPPRQPKLPWRSHPLSVSFSTGERRRWVNLAATQLPSDDDLLGRVNAVNLE
jgi:hypothetical protein